MNFRVNPLKAVNPKPNHLEAKIITVWLHIYLRPVFENCGVDKGSGAPHTICAWLAECFVSCNHIESLLDFPTHKMTVRMSNHPQAPMVTDIQ